MDKNSKPSDFSQTRAYVSTAFKKNGVLERSGHTEATVDLMRLAGLEECGLCCEIMDDDGQMMKTPKLIELAKKWDMKFVTIEQLQNYRKRFDKLVKCEATTDLPTSFGIFKAKGYKNIINGEHHIALVRRYRQQ